MSKKLKFYRFVWRIIYVLFFRFSPRPFHFWRNILLRIFGAEIDAGVHVYPSARIWAPKNLVMHNNACIGDYVDCYNVDKVTIGDNATVSQYSYLCTASHDYSNKIHDLIHSPISIEKKAWVCADCFIGSGVTVGEGSVVGARSSVFRDLEPWGVYAGNPAKFIKKRELNEN